MTIDQNALRMYIIFRADLPEMTRAKGEVQAAHAAASLIFTGLVNNSRYPTLSDSIHQYMGVIKYGVVNEGQAKVVMEVDDAASLIKIWRKAEERGVNVVGIEDQAHTVFTEPTFTCVAFGPCSKTDGNALTRDARKRT